jgi:RHS repeat-associated protein
VVLNERLYALQDANWNVTTITNSSGVVQERYAYQAYGTCSVLTSNFTLRTSSFFAWETRYGSYRFDEESALYQVRHRYLHTVLGSWISRDPIKFDGSRWNVYKNVDSNPYNGLDPFALCTVLCYRAQLGHITCWISSSQNPTLGGTNIDGTSDNDAEESGNRPPPDHSRVVGRFENVPEEKCSCLGDSVQPWNDSPVNQRTRTCSACPRNSNWVMKCLLKRCAMELSGPKPFGLLAQRQLSEVGVC